MSTGNYLGKFRQSLKQRGVLGTASWMLEFLGGLGLLSRPGRIRAYWFETPELKNFGDVLTPYLIQKITGQHPERVNRHCLRIHYAVVGSVMRQINGNAVVWGSGVIAQDDTMTCPRLTLAVRGPLTRHRLLELGYPCPEVYGDPGLLLPLVYTPNTSKQYEIGIIPHHVDFQKINAMNLGKDIRVINILDPIEKVIDEIYSCRYTFSSSLHGIITSHAYGIPSLWVQFSDELMGDGTKFLDYFASLGKEAYEPTDYRDAPLELGALRNLIIGKEPAARAERAVIKQRQEDLLRSCPFEMLPFEKAESRSPMFRSS